MTADSKSPEGFSLKRWSRRKLESTRTAEAPAAPAAPPVSAAPATATVVPANAGTQRLSTNATGTQPARGRQESVPTAPATTAGAAATPVAALPPIESLTIDSDFTAFMQPKVGETLKRQALRKLFGDPHFNVMDGLDVYIDDYSKPDPISPDVVKQLVQARYIFDPPPTRINKQGWVEDVPPEEVVVQPPASAMEVTPQAAPPAAATGADPAAAPVVPEASPEPAAPDVAAPADPARPEPAAR